MAAYPIPSVSHSTSTRQQPMRITVVERRRGLITVLVKIRVDIPGSGSYLDVVLCISGVNQPL